MAWTYGDWESQPTAQTQHARLILFRTELRNAITAKFQSDGTSVDAETVRMLLDMTEKDRARLQSQVDAATGLALPRMVSTYSPRRAY